MKSFGIGLVVFGLFICFFPEIVAYLLGIFIIVIGANILLADTLFRKNSKSSFQFGDYEILKKKK